MISDHYFIYGSSVDDVIAGYRTLTGQAPMYGKWAYGYWQSKEHYENRDELLSAVHEYRQRQIPIDNIVQDWDYWDGSPNWGQLFFDKKKYPHPEEMIAEIHKLNFHIMISIWPGLGPNTAIYKEMAQKGYLFNRIGWGGFRYYDAFIPEANNLYWQYMKKGLFSKGIDAWWIDSTEPDIVNATMKDAEEYEVKKIGKNYLGSWARYLNAYSLAMTDALYKNQRRVTDQKRVYIFENLPGHADQFALHQNYPNPFNPLTTISYSLPRASIVTLKLYDVVGREITTLVHHENKAAGNFKVSYDARNLPGGVYLCRLRSENFAEMKTIRMLVIK